jgi:nitroreductase
MKSTEEIEKIKHGPAVSGVEGLILRRWSPRSFADREVKVEDLRKMFEAAGWAASSYNEQPWRFFLGLRGDETYQRIFDALGEFNQMWAKSAPVLILSIAKKTFSHSGQPNRFGLHDTGAATAMLGLEATALGLHTHSMAGFDADKARASFNVPDDYDMGAVTAVGYLGDSSVLPEHQRAMEESPRSRKSLHEYVLAGWEQPAKL